jgi:hypothetical protein
MGVLAHCTGFQNNLDHDAIICDGRRRGRVLSTSPAVRRHGGGEGPVDSGDTGRSEWPPPQHRHDDTVFFGDGRYRIAMQNSETVAA